MNILEKVVRAEIIENQSDLLKETVYACSKCRSENVLKPMWVFANDQDFLTITAGSVKTVHFDICLDCNAPTSIRLETREIS